MMDTTPSEAVRLLSRRGHGYATGAKKTLENVINNLWDPEDNPNGFVSLGVAENANYHCKSNAHTVANVPYAGIDARRVGKLCQRLGPFSRESIGNGFYR